MLEPNHYSVLFTGGIDSTYRLCQLARDEKAIVQPVYIMFPARPELQREIEAQNKILEYVLANPNTQAKILPIKRVNRDDIPSDRRIMELEGELAKYNFGWQYLYTALYARWDVGVEMCHETLPEEFLEGKVKFKMVNGRRFTDTDGMEESLALIFANLTWPILNTTRQQMIEDLSSWGYDGVWKLIWFCYKAINGKPCGICDNCRVKMQEGLLFLFTKEALHRYLVYSFVHDCMPDTAWDYYYSYVYEGCADKLKSNDPKKDRWYIRFRQLEKLSIIELKNILLNGSSKFNENLKQRREKLRTYPKDLERKKKLKILFRKMGL